MIKVTGKTKNGYGMLIGFQDWNNYFEFKISEVGQFLIAGKIEGVVRIIQDWTRTSTISSLNQINNLKVLKITDKLYFYINGIKVAESALLPIRQNKFGVLISENGEFICSEITHREFQVLENFKGKSQVQNENKWLGSGTGFFVSNDGYITTNYHVIENAKEIEIEYLSQGKKLIYTAKVIKTDQQNDLAILKIIDPKFKNIQSPYSINKSIRNTGEYVFALGFPMALSYMGDEVKFTDGRISANSGYRGNKTHYQISVPVQPGNSGGPLVDGNGDIIGIVCAKIPDADNVSYAIKAEYLTPLLAQLNISNNRYDNLNGLTLVDKIKKLSECIVLIKIK
jgi:S1-C subfamily serine protease